MVLGICFALFAVMTVLAVVLSCRHSSVAQLLKRIRKIAVFLLSFAFVCIVGVVILLSTFSYASDLFSSVFSAEYILHVRGVLKVIFGSESVFTSLQMLGAISLFLFSFASCAFCLCSVYILFVCTQSELEGDVENSDEQKVSLPDFICVRRFALLSRYLI